MEVLGICQVNSLTHSVAPLFTSLLFIGRLPLGQVLSIRVMWAVSVLRALTTGEWKDS